MADKSRNVTSTLARMNAISLGVSLGILSGFALACATVILRMKGGHPSLHLGLLSQYFPGYKVSYSGAVIGGLWTGAATFITVTPVGWLYYRNLLSKLPDSSTPATESALQGTVARLKKREFAAAVGLLLGGAAFVATALLLINHDPGKPLGPHLSLLGHFLPGFRISWAGSLLGFFYLSILGGGVAIFVAAFYNRLVRSSEQ